jgi:hypothetical protein
MWTTMQAGRICSPSLEMSESGPCFLDCAEPWLNPGWSPSILEVLLCTYDLWTVASFSYPPFLDHIVLCVFIYRDVVHCSSYIAYLIPFLKNMSLASIWLNWARNDSLKRSLASLWFK